jgi:hypothetical protein
MRSDICGCSQGVCQHVIDRGLKARVVIAKSVEHEDTEPLIVGEGSHPDKSRVKFGDVVKCMAEGDIGTESHGKGFLYDFDLCIWSLILMVVTKSCVHMVRITVNTGEVVVMIGDMFKNESTECKVADRPAICSSSVDVLVRAEEGAIEVSTETVSVHNYADMPLPFLPVAFGTV